MTARRLAVLVVVELCVAVAAVLMPHDDDKSVPDAAPDPTTTRTSAALEATTSTTATTAVPVPPNPDAVQYAVAGTYVYSVFQNCCNDASNREVDTVTGTGPQVHDIDVHFIRTAPLWIEQHTYEHRDGAVYLTRSQWRYPAGGAQEDCDWEPDIYVLPDPITERQWSTDSWCDVASRRGRIRAIAETVRVSRPHEARLGGRRVRAWDITAQYEYIQRFNSDGGPYEAHGCNIETREFAPSLGLVVSSKGFCIDQPGGQQKYEFVYNRTLVTS